MKRCPHCGACQECGSPYPALPRPIYPMVPYQPPSYPQQTWTNPHPWTTPRITYGAVMH